MPTRERRAEALGLPLDQLPDNRGRAPKPRGAESHRWRGGRSMHVEGYLKIFVGRDHPLGDPNGYAYEHLVVWCAAGNPRPGPDQLLHHRNERKDDNRLENLEIVSRSHHSKHHIAARQRDPSGRLLPAGRP